MIRLGLVCIFRQEPIKFRRTTAKYLSTRKLHERLDYLSEIVSFNTKSLSKALNFCVEKGIGDFRINSQILPLKTHPEIRYELKDLPAYDQIKSTLKKIKQFSRSNNLRTTFHPDQFVVLSSPNPEVVKKSIEELEYQAEFSELVGSDVINIHAGGAYGDKKATLERFRKNFDTLPLEVKTRLTLENDDRLYSPQDLLPVCRDLEIPLVYDVHHHRCLKDDLTEEEATELAMRTWNREPLLHLSSPRFGWGEGDCRLHHDYIDIRDFPKFWEDLDVTVEVEAKAKEIAVLDLKVKLESSDNSLDS